MDKKQGEKLLKLAREIKKEEGIDKEAALDEALRRMRKMKNG